MAAHLTEEEQIEAIKRWWKNNGKFTVGVILAVIVAWFAWTLWQDRQERIAQETSRQFSELMASVDTQGEALTEEQKATAQVIAQDIVDAKPKTLYGNLAALMLARFAVEDGELDQAESQLRLVASNAANTSMANLANLRLARVLSAKGEHDAALSLLGNDVDAAYLSAYAEARGDVYLAQDEREAAQTAYQEALENLDPQQSARSGILRLKLDNARVANQDASSDETAPATAAEGDA